MGVKQRIKSILPRSLFMRSLLIMITPILLLQVITTYIFFDRHWEKMTDRLAAAVAGEIAIIADQVEQAGENTEEIKLIETYYGRALGMEILFQPGGILRKMEQDHKSWGTVVSKTLSRQIRVRVKRPYDIRTDIEEKWVEVTVQLENGALVIVTPQRRLFSSSAYIFLLWMIAVSLVLLFISILFMRNQIKPIRRLAIAAEKFGMGRDVPFLKIEGAREVRAAAKAFLEMRERIDRQIQQRTAMLAGVSHDLRTPLTRMKLQLEMLGDNPDANAMKQDIADMEKMIAAYLDFARGEGGEPSERLDLSALVRRIIEAAQREQGSVQAHIEPNISTVGRPVALERCMTNLLGNALKYAEHVDVHLSSDQEAVHIVFDDNGPGIPQDLREEVFKPFFRAEGSRNQKTGGVGLGLPIAQDIILAHGGTIDLLDSPQGGLRVYVRLPI